MFAIGPSLHEARSRRGLSAEDVQKAIRIRERYLTAIEEERWDLLPGDAYVKGFLRTYADFLGLDGNLYVDEYNSRFAHHEEERLVPASLAPAPSPRVGLARPLLVIGAIAAAIAAVAAWQLHGGGGGTATSASSTTPAAPVGKVATTRRKHAPPPPAATVARKPPPPALPRRAILRATRGPVWLLVRAGDANGAVVYEGVLEQGKTLPVSLTHAVWIRIGAPWNLDVRLGGKLAHGLPAQTGNVLLTRHGLSPAA